MGDRNGPEHASCLVFIDCIVFSAIQGVKKMTVLFSPQMNLVYFTQAKNKKASISWST